ncbi:putative radical SAM superfamily Fe-S cluster-containing enzyme/SAM-dependent methyltransferase [Aequitasia blattaphilus]|uniref:Radical SAM protein n=1 Tax=Aequitasia blattaphilus TaxID=2949332 RepID=A0ABT1E8E1_9FIRM|nr:radical SAM protein [Aequitasia blattaphilus]MCR8614725.1 radical SAM protein [Aequitasia blattaphilus]
MILHKTKSLCPICLKRIDASYESKGDEVWFRKECKEHGFYEVLFWKGVENFQEKRNLHAPQPPKKPMMDANQGCPYDCGLCKNHKQATCCVLFEVTSACDLGCPICFASAKEDENPISMEKIKSWYEMLMERGGPFNIQLSGGEPTTRDDLDEIIRMGKRMGFTFFQLNTNGIRIGTDREYLRRLKAAGLNTVFLQYDSPHSQAVVKLRGRDVIKEKEGAIRNCKEVGLSVVLVPTLMRDCNEEHIGEVLDFAVTNMPTVKGVHFQPMSYFGRYEEEPDARAHISLPELLNRIQEQTGGKAKAEDFSFGRAEHPLCSINADYIIKNDVWEVVRKADQSCCCSSDVAREAVANKWSIEEDVKKELGKSFDLDALDQFLEERQNHTLAISAMAFQDVWTVDLERLERCYINIVSEEGKLVPFCAYNLTAQNGTSLYRGKETPCKALKSITGGPIRIGGLELTDRGAQICGIKEGMRILDIGCGSGESVEFLRKSYGALAEGIDTAVEMIVSGKKRTPDLPIEVGSLESILVKEKKYDVIFMECTLSHMEDTKEVLKSVNALLKEKGKLVLTDVYSRINSPIQDQIKSAGFCIQEFEDHTALLRDLTIKLILKYGSLEEFAAKECKECKKCSLCEFMKVEKPGYYLLVAEKEGV